MRLVSRFVATAALVAATLGFGSQAHAGAVTATFSGSFAGEFFIDPNGGFSSLGAFSGSATWSPSANTASINVTIQTSGYGPLTINGPSFIPVESQGEFLIQTNVGIAPSVQPFVFRLDLFGPNIGGGHPPTEPELSGLAGAIVGFDNGADFFFSAGADVLATIAFETPEPATLALLGLGLAGFGLVRRRRVIA